MTSKQIQKAGDHSNQLQANVINQYFGADEHRIIEIVDERCAFAMSNCIAESRLIVEQRVGDFKSEIISLLVNRPELIDALNEPSCVYSLEKAANTAAKTPEERDSKLLAELLCKRFENPTDRHVATGVNKAIEIVDLLTEEELNGLTVYFAVSQYGPVSSSVDKGLAALDLLYSKLPIEHLPIGDDWIDNLDIHDALRNSQFSSLKKMEEYLFESLNGYTVWGLQAGSEEEAAAIDAIMAAGIPCTILVPHELHEGYVRLDLRSRSGIDDLAINQMVEGRVISTPLSCDQKELLSGVFDKTTNPEHETEMKTLFSGRLKSFKSISAVMSWWNSIPSAPRLTVVGRVLASANARRLDPSLPELDK